MSPSTITTEDIAAYLRWLDADIHADPAGECTFSNGDPVFLCTSSARRVAEKFGGIVVGFHRDENPDAGILDGEDGHDFAIVAGRFVVDYWAGCLAGGIDRSVFDLLNADDRAAVMRLYGPQHAWKAVPDLHPTRTR